MIIETIPQLFEESLKKYGQNPLIREKKDGVYQSVSYQEVHSYVQQFASALLDLGIEKNDRVALISEGRSEWLISELASLYCGAIVVPLSIKLSEVEELRFRLDHSGCRYIIVSGQQADKIRSLKSQIKTLEKVILLDNDPGITASEITYEKLLLRGKESLPRWKEKLEKRWKNIKGDDIATISYTSGTTADPKGIMLTHLNYISNLEQANSLIDVPQWYTTLLILSWDHSFAHTVGLYVMIRNGASLAVVAQGKTQLETLRNIPLNLKEVRPVFMLSVPALARSFRKSIEKGVKGKGEFMLRLFQQALNISYSYNGNGHDPKTMQQILLAPLVKFFDYLLFRKIRESFGGRLKFFIGGGALLDLELQQFFYAIGIPMFQGYGLTEASPVISSNTPSNHKLGSSGKPVKDLRVKIVDEQGQECDTGVKGEIIVAGKNVMSGYWKNPEATESTLREGWLHTGDLGYLDKDGFLFVLGRYKSLLIGNDGEKYSPEGIEEAIVDFSPYIDQCMLYNNQNPYTTALLAINAAALRSHLRKQGMDTESDESVRESIRLVNKEIERFAQHSDEEKSFPQRWMPAAIAILPEPFTEDNGMINSTLKMVRPKVTKHYASLLEFLYTPSGKDPFNQKNVSAIRQILNK